MKFCFGVLICKLEDMVWLALTLTPEKMLVFSPKICIQIGDRHPVVGKATRVG